ncbi:MAG TPA: nitrous oxide reductase accessory protein NosL [Geobacteraceae bacterium]
MRLTKTGVAAVGVLVVILAVIVAAPGRACDCGNMGKSAANGAAAAKGPVAADVNEYPGCTQCGMHRDRFDYSRAYVEFTDGSKAGTCSIGCVADEVKNAPAKKVKLIRVADYQTRQLLDAATAYWVIGGDVSGVMTRTPKWAFADKAAAEAFIKEHGGRLIGFADVWQAALAE